MGSAEILVSGGVAAVLAAVAGGGLKAFGVELPLLATVKRQLMVSGVGVTLIGLGLVSDAGVFGAKPAVENSAAPKVAAGPAASNTVDEPWPDTRTEGVYPPPPTAPDIGNMGFPEARRMIVRAGWSPIIQETAPHDNPLLGLRGEEIEASDYREAVYCQGTGAGLCLLRYRQGGQVLEVFVGGDKLESGVVDKYNVRDCKERPRPEGCLAE